MNRSTLALMCVGSAISLICFAAVSPVSAGGILGDIVNTVIPGAGTALDDAHRQVKNAIPPYKALEESASRTVNEAFVQAGAPALQELLARSRDDALRNGVQPIPDAIRRNLTGFIPDNILNVARYRVKGGGDLTLQVNAIRYGEAQAITLDYVIVFKEENDASYNPTLWAHELTHVGQFQRWGIHDFAIRYLRSYQDVENEAYQTETRYVAWAGLRNSGQFASTGGPINAGMVNRPVSPFGAAGTSNLCGTAIGVCQVNGSAPVGTPCWCNTLQGAATGSLIPSQFTPAASTGLPSGSGMLPCGCWGPNPVQIVPEPRCASQRVRISVCQGFCAPLHPLYGYVCM